jgi:hypothetical protein
LTTLDAELGSSQNIELVASCLTLKHHKFHLNRSSITLDIVKNLSRGQTVTVQKWTVTVQAFVNEIF